MMLVQPILEKLAQLHLPAFREGLKEQLNNPQYADLSFEERLALLVDREFTSRHERRIQRRIKLANFPQSAPIEDLDLSVERGLNRRLILELAQSTGSPTTSTPLSSARLVQGKPSSVWLSAWLPAETISLCATSALPACFSIWLSPNKMVLILPCSPAWQRQTCSFSTIGCVIPFPRPAHRPCSKSSTIAIPVLPPSSLLRCRFLTGLLVSLIRP